MENSQDPDQVSGLVVQETSVKPPLKFYVRRKFPKLLNKLQNVDESTTSPQKIKTSELVDSDFSSDFNIDNTAKVESVKKSEEPENFKDDPQSVNEEGKEKCSEKIRKKQRYHRPRIMEDGKKPRDPTNLRMRTISKKRSKKEKDHEDEDVFEVRTPEKQSFPKRRKKKANKNVARTLKLDEEISPTCLALELGRSSIPNFPKGKRRMTSLRRTDFHVLISPSFPMPIWKKHSKRSNRRKNMIRWTRIALSFECLEETLVLVEIHPSEKDIKRIAPKLNLMHSKQEITVGSKEHLKKAKKVGKLVTKEKTHEKDNGHEDVAVQTKGSKEHLKKAKKVAKLVTKEEKTHEKDNGHEDVAVQTKDIFITSSVCVAPNSRTKEQKDMEENLILQLNYQKDHNLSSLADVPLHIEDTLVKSVSYIKPEESTKKAKGVAKLIKEMKKLNIKGRTTTLGKAKKKLVKAKVNLDPETIKEWELLMENDLPDTSHVKEEETECKWKEERKIFQSRIELFINRMHFLQGNRKFKQWKGSAVDSVVGVFLTQNVSDYLSSNAFMSVAAKFPVDAKESLETLGYSIDEPQEVIVGDGQIPDQNEKEINTLGYSIDEPQEVSSLVGDGQIPIQNEKEVNTLGYSIDEPQEVNSLVGDGQIPIQNEKDDAKSSLESVSSQENLKQHEKDAKRKNKKTGIMEDENVDWESLRKVYTRKGFRETIHMDTVDWNAVRLSDQQVLADTIMKRGQHNGLARKILKFLNDEAKQNGSVDLEWLRDAPSDLVKRYLLEIEGIGLKSAECVRLLGLKHSAFPVDTNVGRIAVRLGWVPLEPLPDGVQMHQLFQYPSMDSIQKYLWPRLCKLSQELLYELHYQMITFGKVFCTKVIPNCNACPMKSECKYFASAYVSSKVLLEGPEEKTTQESQTSYCHDDDDAKMTQESETSYCHDDDDARMTQESDTSYCHDDDDARMTQESDTSYCHDNDAKMTSKINSIEECVSTECSNQTNCCEPIVEFPSSPTREIPELPDIEDTPCRSSCRSNDATPGIGIDMDALKKNVVDALIKVGAMLNGSNDEISKALAVMTPENACIPMNLPRKTKYYDRLRTEHVVYVLPDNHELLNDFERRERDDPSPYLLALWQPGETSYSFMPPKKKCNSDGTNLCTIKTCSYCWKIREDSSNTYRGTILIPCRTAMRGGFPLNGTYFQTNEVFADHETSLKPIVFSRDLCNGLEKRALYCGSSVTSIFRLLDETRIQLCFWTGFVCMRGFNRKKRDPEALVRRLHTPPDERGEKHMRDD